MIKSLPAERLKLFVKEYCLNFSFLKYKPEFDLFKDLVKRNTKIYGVEQISIFADQMVISKQPIFLDALEFPDELVY